MRLCFLDLSLCVSLLIIYLLWSYQRLLRRGMNKCALIELSIMWTCFVRDCSVGLRMLGSLFFWCDEAPPPAMQSRSGLEWGRKGPKNGSWNV